MCSSDLGGEVLATSGVTGSPAFSTTATLTSPVGVYPLVAGPGSLAAQNYAFQFGTSTLAVTAGPFVKLQVLVPGETAAPTTPTGKTGTPDPQLMRAPIPVTVNAVDAYWNVVTTATDTVRLTSSDSAALLPADSALLGGTVQFVIALRTLGTWTVTADDVTQPGIYAQIVTADGRVLARSSSLTAAASRPSSGPACRNRQRPAVAAHRALDVEA